MIQTLQLKLQKPTHHFLLIKCPGVGCQPNGMAPISSTDKQLKYLVRSTDTDTEAFSAPRRLETHEIPLVINDFKVAARNAVEAGKCRLYIP